MAKIGMLSLGCDKNRVDSEKILYTLKNEGHVFADNYADADIILINTCAFIDEAKRESLEAIMECAEATAGLNKKIVVLGCLAKRYADELVKEMPEVSVFVGQGGYANIADIIKNISSSPRIINPEGAWQGGKGRLLTTPEHYAYLKIAEGCNNCCSYCAIPAIRGRYRSEPIKALEEEASELYSTGVKELIIVAQDTLRYGYDLYGKYAIIDLLSALEDIGFECIRLMYAYPDMVTDELIDYILSSKSMAKYLDIPLQHIDDGILKRMNRRTTSKEISALLDGIKAKSEDFVIRSTFITGFPGEGQKEFELLKKFICEGPVDYAGFFPFSPEEGTKAVGFSPRVPQRVRLQRAKGLEQAQLEKIAKNNAKYVGRVLRVIYEDIDYDLQKFSGRCDFQAPDIDPQVRFSSDKPLSVGNYYSVKITHADFYLHGETV
ncbi:MAG: 30S ribosomal protein S12 methylthiotransferase RimO [Christensenellales bacterium]|jgi:ribosomal protein S12 methylthiotransferase